MIPKLAEIGGTLHVSESDLKAIERSNRRSTLEKVALVAAPAVSAVVGLLAGDAAVPLEPRPPPYPLAAMAAAGPVALTSRKSWLATAALSVLLFVLAFSLMAWVNAGINDSYGLVPRYSTFSPRR